MSEKINLSLFEEIFESSSPANYAKMFINTKDLDKNKEIVEEIKDRMLDLKERMKKMSKTEKKMLMREIINKILDYNKNAPIYFQLASKADKKKSEPKTEESIAERVKLRKQKLDVINKNKEKMNNELFKEYFTYSNPDTMTRILKDVGDEKNKNMVESIKKKPK